MNGKCTIINSMINRSKFVENARLLRLKAKTFRQIASELNLPLSTVHLWTRDIVLSPEQHEQIRKVHLDKFKAARIEHAHLAKRARETAEGELFNSAKLKMHELVQDSFFLIGLGLYWAEGFKKDYSLGFVNSDPTMVNFFLDWLYRYGHVDSSEIRVRVQINKIYESSIKQIEEYWARELCIPKEQFQKPFFLESKKVRIENDSYKGLVRIRAIGTRKLFVQIQGWLAGFKELLRKDGIISPKSG